MQRQYKAFSEIVVDGDVKYCAGVEQCLDLIAATPDGLKLLNAICSRSHQVIIKHTDTGNSCARLSDDANPKLINAIEKRMQASFQMEMSAALAKGKSGGITLEHLARQLTLGLSPATYKTALNVVRPKAMPMPGVASRDVMMRVGLDIADRMQILNGLASGAWPLTKLPPGWDKDLPRLLRNFLTPGSGSGSTVNFNATKTFHCVDDPAMHQRPPAIGLAHELIHSLHNAKGVRMAIVNANGQKLEEIITTGFPP